MTDISNLVPKDEAQTLDLLHPITNEPLLDEETGQTVALFLYGDLSPQFQKASRQAALAKAKGKRNASEVVVDEVMLDTLVKVTSGWRHLNIGGPVEFSEAKCREVYNQFPWIREQAFMFVQDRSKHLGN